MPSQPSNSLLGLNLEELTNLALGSGQPSYRGQQLFDAIYRQKIAHLDRVSTLSLEYRARLAEQGWAIGFPSIARKFVSSDGTVRYLVELADGETVETVWMPEGDGGESGDGSEAGDDLRIEPSGMRGELQVLFYGVAWDQAQSGGGRNCWPDPSGAPRAGS
jgi:23S rRNA (adenine2503-C2)-methyltransferase